MKRDIEIEFRSAAVAKRTRAGTERFLVKKLYGEGKRRRKGRERMDEIPDVEIVEVESEKKMKDSEVGKRSGKDWFDALPDVEVVSSSSVSDDDVPNMVAAEEKGKGKEKEKMVDDDDVVVVSKGECDSAWGDNDETNSGCLGRKDGGDSVGSRNEFGSTSKPDVEVEDGVSFSNGLGNENEMVGDADVVSSEGGSETEVSLTDSDEDFDVHMAEDEASFSSEFVSDTGSEDEFAIGDKGQEVSCGVKCDSNASPCHSDDVIFLYEMNSEKEILDENVAANDNSSCGKPSFSKTISVHNEGKCAENVCISSPEVEIRGEEVTHVGNVFCEEPTPNAEDLVIDLTKKEENIFLDTPNKEDKLDEKSSFVEKGSSVKSVPNDKGLKAHRTKADDFAWNVCEGNSNHSKNTFSKCSKHTQGSVKFKPIVEDIWDDGTVRNVITSKTISHINKTFVDPSAPKESSTRSNVNEEVFASEVNGISAFDKDVKDNFTKETFVVNSISQVKYTTKSKVNPGKIYSGKVLKTVDYHAENRTQKEVHLNDFTFNVDNAYKEERSEVMVVSPKGKNIKPYSKKRNTALEKINVFDVFFNTLINKRDAADDDLVKATVETQQHGYAEPAAPQIFPMLKFTFGVDTPVQLEKTDFQLELEDLWDEFQYAIRTTEIGSLAPGTVKTTEDTSSKIKKSCQTFCNKGDHILTLVDEVGIQCIVCPFVQLEIKYVMPDWGTYSSRKFGRRASSDDEDPEIFDGMKFCDSKIEEQRNCSDGTVWDLIPGVKDELYPHQQDGFEFIWLNLMGSISLDELRSSTNNGMGGCIISHAPGTGKTRLTIEFLLSYLELFPDSCPLIIAPAGMLLTWEAEFKKWGVGIPFHNFNNAVLSGKENTAALNIFNASRQSSTTNLVRLLKLYSWIKQKSILGLSYSLFEKLAGRRQSNNKKDINEQGKKFGELILENAGLVVLDEGHTPRNSRSRINKALNNIKTKKRIILSGTPFQNNLAELYTILSFVRPEFAETISPALRKFCQRKVRMVNVCSGRSEQDVDRDDREALSQLRCKIDPFVHVHNGAVLQKRLPGLKDCVMVLNPPHYQKQIVEIIESNSYTNFEFEHKLSLGTIHPSLLLNEKDESFIDKAELKARRLDPNEGIKTKFLFEMLKLSEANNEKVLVFSQYLDPLGLIKDQICSLLHWQEGKEVLRLVGKMESEQRQSIIDVFNDPHSSAKVLLASTKACSEGINLIGASRVVLLDVVWNPSVERQAISRAFRLGQKKVVYSYNLIVGRMEWEKYGAQAKKEHVSNLVFCSNNEPGTRGRVLSEDKILDALITHNSMEDIFERIVYYPKDSLYG